MAGMLQLAQTFTAVDQPVTMILWVKRGGEEARLDFSTEADYRQAAWFLRTKQSEAR
jgi:hypothetical protein